MHTCAVCRGLQPPPLRLKQQVEPLWTVSQHVESAPVAQKLPPASVLAAVPKHKEWPETAQVRCCQQTAPPGSPASGSPGGMSAHGRIHRMC